MIRGWIVCSIGTTKANSIRSSSCLGTNEFAQLARCDWSTGLAVHLSAEGLPSNAVDTAPVACFSRRLRHTLAGRAIRVGLASCSVDGSTVLTTWTIIAKTVTSSRAIPRHLLAWLADAHCFAFLKIGNIGKPGDAITRGTNDIGEIGARRSLVLAGLANLVLLARLFGVGVAVLELTLWAGLAYPI